MKIQSGFGVKFLSSALSVNPIEIKISHFAVLFGYGTTYRSSELPNIVYTGMIIILI